MASVKKDLITLELRTRQQWREWLEQNHSTSPGVWLVFLKAHTAAESIAYEDSVREALCFGWIDSIIKRLDDDRYARKFTPRQPTSKWSEINRQRWMELESAGLLTATGLSAAPTENRYAPRPVIPDLPDYIAEALSANRQAWAHFQQLSPTSRRDFIGWIHSAKRPETRQRRILESLAVLEAGGKLGLK